MTQETKNIKPLNMRQELMDIVTSEFGDILTDFNKGNVYKSTHRLPLHLFEMHFLAYFKGEVKDPEECKTIKATWLEVSGHAGRTVDIFDPATEEVLFSIPAFINGNVIDPTKSEAFSFALRQYNYHAERSQTTAVMYLIKNKDKITENITVSNKEELKLEGWKSFMKYYKLGKSDSNTDKPENDPNASDDFFDFGI